MALRIPVLSKHVLERDYGDAFGPARAIGVENDRGFLTAGVVYHNYDPFFRSIELSCASEGRRWLTPPVLRALLRYPFGSLECIRCTGITPRKSDESRRFLERLGFKREGVIRRGFGDDHAMVYGLLAEEWAKGRYGAERSARSGAELNGEEVRTRTAARA